MEQVNQGLERLVIDAVKDAGCSLYHLSSKGHRLQIYVSKRGGATVGDCEDITKALRLSMAGARKEWRNLEIEVSTPGIERRLYTPEHFRTAVGERLQIKLEEEVIVARLKDADREGIQVEIKPGRGRRITYNEILSARVQRSTEELFKRR